MRGICGFGVWGLGGGTGTRFCSLIGSTIFASLPCLYRSGIVNTRASVLDGVVVIGVGEVRLGIGGWRLEKDRKQYTGVRNQFEKAETGYLFSAVYTDF